MEWQAFSGWELQTNGHSLEISYSPPSILPIFASLSVSILVIIPGFLTAFGNLEILNYLFFIFAAVAIFISSKFFSASKIIDNLDLETMTLSTYKENRKSGSRIMLNKRNLQEIGTPKLVIVEGGDGTFGPNFDHTNPGIYTVNLTCEARYPGLQIVKPESRYHTSKCGASIVMRNYDIVICGGLKSIDDSQKMLDSLVEFLSEKNQNWSKLSQLSPEN